MSPMQKTLSLSLLVVLGMPLAIPVVLIPIYNLVCEWTGINQGGSRSYSEAAIAANLPQPIKLEFITHLERQLSATFEAPASLTLANNQAQTVYFKVANLTDQDKELQAVASITPYQASPYVQKIECFCFTKQTLKAGERRDMAVRLYLKDDIPDDLTTITLSYTLFDLTEESDV